MAFLIRQISRTADGRDIVRDRRVDAETLTIGRAADNDLAIPDLAVDPHHLRIERQGAERILVSATGTLGFRVEGRKRTTCIVDCDKGAEIALGGHRITATRDDAGLVVLTVAPDAVEERDEGAGFSLRGLLPGKRRSAWVLALVVLAAFLALPVWSYVEKSRGGRSIYAAAGDQAWSSGPLSSAHHALEGKCESCHGKAFVSVRDTSCVACHKDAHEHAGPARMADARAAPDATGRLLQRVAASFGKQPPGGCIDCHSEHEGAGPMPPTRQKFCADCHGTLDARLADTKLGNADDFTTSHPQFRPLVRTAPGKVTRVSLDTRPAEDGGLKFPHKLHLDPRSGVSRMAQTLKRGQGYGEALTCASCHTPTADGVRFLPVEMEKSCQGCHSLGFDRDGPTVRTLRHGDPAQVVADLRALYRWSSRPRPLQLGGIARQRPGQVISSGGGQGASADPARAVFERGGACYDCHTLTPPAGARGWRVAPVEQPMRYMRHGWFDHAAHKTQTCTSCHATAPESTRASDLLLPGIATCRTCHGGEDSSRAKVPSGCAMCHSYHIGPGAPWQSRQSARPRRKAGGGEGG